MAMKTKNKQLLSLFLLGAVGLSMTACTSQPVKKGHSKQPDWVVQHSPEFGVGCASRHYYGVQVSQVALMSAKANLVTNKESHIKVKTNYKESSVNNGPLKSNYDQAIVDATEMNTSGITVVKSWTDPLNGDVCLLVKEY